MHEEHLPVLPTEVLEWLRPPAGAIVVDATWGRGGHGRRLLEAIGPEGRLLAIDRDAQAIASAHAVAAADPRVCVAHRPFAAVGALCRELGWHGRVAAILLDLGVSSPQLDGAERGFSLMQDGPLDMRMDRDGQAASAADWVRHTPESAMISVFRDFGEERYARRIARAICVERRQRPIERTLQLAEIVKTAHPAWERHRHPATRVFQAIRIAVNDELGQLRAALPEAAGALAPGGRLAVISFHSLEDRMVKRFMRDGMADDAGVRRIKVIARNVRATDDEVRANPRARSAVLRVAERVASTA